MSVSLGFGAGLGGPSAGLVAVLKFPKMLYIFLIFNFFNSLRKVLSDQLMWQLFSWPYFMFMSSKTSPNSFLLLSFAFAGYLPSTHLELDQNILLCFPWTGWCIWHSSNILQLRCLSRYCWISAVHHVMWRETFETKIPSDLLPKRYHAPAYRGLKEDTLQNAQAQLYSARIAKICSFAHCCLILI